MFRISDLIEVMKALSHEYRLRILNLINREDLCVCEIEYILQITQSNASRHLNKLKQAGLVFGEKKAQWIYYQIRDEALKEYQFLELLINQELAELTICREDNRRLLEYQASGLSCEDLT